MGIGFFKRAPNYDEIMNAASPVARASVDRGQDGIYRTGESVRMSVNTYRNSYTLRILHLVTVTSVQEEAFIRQFTENAAIWIGATDQGSEGIWRWITGETFDYSNFLYTQPDNWSENNEGAQNFALFWEQDGISGWEDGAGYALFPFVCEIDSAPGETDIPQATRIVSVDVTASATSVTVYCTEADAGASVFCAAYDGSGRLTGVEIKTATSGEQSYEFSFSTGSSIKVFVLDAQLRPLCGSGTG